MKKHEIFLTKRRKLLLDYITDHPGISTNELMEKFCFPHSVVVDNCHYLIANDLIRKYHQSNDRKGRPSTVYTRIERNDIQIVSFL